VPGKRPGRTRTRKTRTDGDVGAPLGNRSKEKRKLTRPIAVVAVKEYDNIGALVQASPVRQAWPYPRRGSVTTRAPYVPQSQASVCRVVVDDDDLGDERGGKITQDTADGLRLVARRNDD